VDAESVYWANLTRLPSSRIVAPRYGKGDSADAAVSSAQQRYEVEQ
jgi:hypothetical protein